MLLGIRKNLQMNVFRYHNPSEIFIRATCQRAEETVASIPTSAYSNTLL